MLRDIVKYLNKEGKTIKFNMNNVFTYEYYGTYNGVVIFSVWTSLPLMYIDASTHYCFSGIWIEEKPEYRIYAWKQKNIYTIEEAWNSGLLTYDNIFNIAEIKHNSGKTYCTIQNCQFCNKKGE